jgi:hypothetical protein
MRLNFGLNVRMNFSTYKKELITSIENALNKSKHEMIRDFRLILGKSNSLFKTTKFDFWLKQIGEIAENEIPMTHYGLNEAKRTLDFALSADRNSLENMVNDICESLFSYCHEDDMCCMQADNHSYYHVPTGVVFKESTLGSSTLEADVSSKNDIRIAMVSELRMISTELVG